MMTPKVHCMPAMWCLFGRFSVMAFMPGLPEWCTESRIRDAGMTASAITDKYVHQSSSFLMMGACARVGCHAAVRVAWARSAKSANAIAMDYMAAKPILPKPKSGAPGTLWPIFPHIKTYFDGLKKTVDQMKGVFLATTF